jgi:hypothetical protein
VSERVHSPQYPQSAAKEGKSEQTLFWDPPFGILGAFFIDSHNDKTTEINDEQIENKNNRTILNILNIIVQINATLSFYSFDPLGMILQK